MGEIRKILYERECGDGFYDKSARIEIAECVHFHYNDMRLFMNKEVFLKVSDMFAKARKKYDQLGQPDNLEQMVLLDDCVLPENIAKHRIAIEIQKDANVHIHYNDLRIHINLGDLMVWFETFEQANANMPYEYVHVLSFDEVLYHPVVEDHLRFLKAYFEEGKYSELNQWAENENSVSIKNKMLERKYDVGNLMHRNFGLPKGWPHPVSKMWEQVYLIVLFQDIRKHGYAQGSLHKKYMTAYEYEDGSVQIINSHRLAVLMALGHTSAICYVVKPDSGWVK